MADFTRVETAHRRIVSEIPHPDSRPLLEELRRLEPRSMSGFAPFAWQRAAGFHVWDGYGNQWLDFSSAVVLANAGHAHPRIAQAIRDQLDRQLLHSYCHPSTIRLDAIKAIKSVLPPYLDKVFLLTTGAEALEGAIKLMRLHGRRLDPAKIHILSYDNSFHGRTMGAQSAGGFADQQEWMGEKPAGFHHIPFPDCAFCPWGKPQYQDCGAECWRRSLERLREDGVPEEQFAGVITETFPGPTVAFMPLDYVREVCSWASEHRALLAFDEVQAGFGRTGKWFGFEHYGVAPDLICMGKGMTSSLPMSAVAGRAEVMDLPGHGEMSSTHTGNPLCCAALIANLAVIREEGLVANAAALGPVARAGLEGLRDQFPGRLGAINGRGLAWAVVVLDEAGRRPDPELAGRVITRCLQLGLLMLPTAARGTLKVAPPLCITREALLEGIEVIGQAIGDCLPIR